MGIKELGSFVGRLFLAIGLGALFFSCVTPAEVKVEDCHMDKAGLTAKITGDPDAKKFKINTEFCRYDYDPDANSDQNGQSHFGDFWKLQLSAISDMPEKYSRLANDTITFFGYISGPDYPADIKLREPPDGYNGYPLRIEGLNEVAFKSERDNHIYVVVSSKDESLPRPEFLFLKGQADFEAIDTSEDSYDIKLSIDAIADFSDWELPPFTLENEEYRIKGKVVLKYDGDIGPQ